MRTSKSSFGLIRNETGLYLVRVAEKGNVAQCPMGGESCLGSFLARLNVYTRASEGGKGPRSRTLARQSDPSRTRQASSLHPLDSCIDAFRNRYYLFSSVLRISPRLSQTASDCAPKGLSVSIWVNHSYLAKRKQHRLMREMKSYGGRRGEP